MVTTLDPARLAALDALPCERPVAAWAWRVIGQRVFGLTFHNWYRARSAILRLFGARVHPSARLRPSVRITHPWNLSVGAHTAVGDLAVLRCVAPVRIGDRCTISQYAHLCPMSLDPDTDPPTLITGEIAVEDDAWVASDVFVGPNVTIGADTVIGSRSTVIDSLAPRSVCAGDRARRLGERRATTPQAPPSPTSVRGGVS